MEIKLYETHDVLKATCQLVEKFYESDKKLQVICANTLMMQELDMFLWQFKQMSFIPHLTEADGEIPESQLVYISSEQKDYKNHASVLILCDVPPLSTLPDNLEVLIGVVTKGHSNKESFVERYKPEHTFLQNINGQWQKKSA